MQTKVSFLSLKPKYLAPIVLQIPYARGRSLRGMVGFLKTRGAVGTWGGKKLGPRMTS